MKKLILLLIPLLLVACGNLSSEEVMTEVLEKIIETDKPVDADKLYDNHQAIYDGFRKYLTSDALDPFMMTSTATRLKFQYSHYDISSAAIDELELDFRETSQEDEVVCYFSLNVILEKDESFTLPISGSARLLKIEEDWLIDVLHLKTGEFIRALRKEQ